MDFSGSIPIYRPFMDRQPTTDISKIYKSCFLLHYQNIMYSMLHFFFKNLENQDL